jgi:hypothetical protein
MDVRSLCFEDATFDIAIDKGQKARLVLLYSLLDPPPNRYNGCHDDCERRHMGPT